MTLLDQGHSQAKVARMLGITPGAVSQWKKARQRRSPNALNAKPHPGPKPKLTAKQRRSLSRLLKQGPRKHGYATELWTLKRPETSHGSHLGVAT